MFEFHKNKDKYFNMQKWVTTEYVIPFIEKCKPIDSGCHVLEIGCAEAGVLAAFLEKGCTGMGIELNESRAAIARKNLAEPIQQGNVAIITSNIYDVDIEKHPEMRFDVIVLKDVIEHIPNQSLFISKLAGFLKPEGIVFFGYPPWQMPFGGHQQICQSKLLSKLPWFHLLPKSVYGKLLRSLGERPEVINELFEIKDTGISIERMYKVLKQNKMEVMTQKHWLLNPIYVKKFSFKAIAHAIKIPYLQNFYTTCHYITFKPKH